MDIQFHITQSKFETLTWDEWNALEAIGEGEFQSRLLKNIAMRFLVDENKLPVDAKQAAKILGQLSSVQMMQALAGLGQAIREYIVPKGNGNESN